jgi:four helix bundle protein
MSSTYQDLRVWQKAMDLAVEIYRTTDRFPKHELYGLIGQIRRAAISVPSNIAEGKGRRTDREFAVFLFHARGSLLEIETQIILARRLQYLQEESASSLLRATAGIGSALSGLINSLRSRATVENELT